MDNMGKISGIQLLFMLLICRLFTIMTFVPLAGEDCGISVQLAAAVISSLIQATAAIPLVMLNNKYPLCSVSGAAYRQSKAYGITLSAIYMVYFLLCAVNSLINFMRFVTSRFLPSNNSGAVMLVLALVCMYCACCKIEGLARACTPAAVFFVIMLAAMWISSSVNFNAENFYTLRVNAPLLYRAVKEDMLRNGEITAAAFLIRSVSGSLRNGLYGYISIKLAAGVIITVLITGVIGDYVLHTDYPFLAAGSFTGADYIQRNDALYLIMWTLAAVITISVYIMISGSLAAEIFPAIKNSGSIFSAAAVYISALILNSYKPELDSLTGILCGGYAIVFLTGIIPLTVILTGRSRRSTTERVTV